MTKIARGRQVKRNQKLNPKGEKKKGHALLYCESFKLAEPSSLTQICVVLKISVKSCKRKDKEIMRKHENSEKMQLSKYKDKDFNVFYCQTFPEDIGTIFQFYISPQHYIFWLKLFLIGTRN